MFHNYEAEYENEIVAVNYTYWQSITLIDTHIIHRESYMSAHVLLNLLNEFGKRDKMRGLLGILSLFCDELNKFNKTRARMLDSTRCDQKVRGK